MIRRIFLALAALLVLATGGFFAWFGWVLPRDIPVAEVRLPATPEAIERGRYLAHHVAVCVDCHSTRDWRFFSGPIMPGTLGRGGERFDAASGLPGVVVSRNITPAALGAWSDGEIHRAITAGLRRNGSALFPLMPYDAYRFMAGDDVLAIVAYLRTLAPIANEVPDHQLDFPLNLIVNAIPQAAAPRPVDPADTVEYGRYLATMAGCRWCHTPVDARQQAVPGMESAGGHEFPMGGFVVRSANLTPDVETGLGAWSREDFIARFRRYAGEDARIPVGEGEFNTIMSWTMYAGMTDADLSAIYAWLIQLPPVRNPVETYQRPGPAREGG